MQTGLDRILLEGVEWATVLGHKVGLLTNASGRTSATFLSTLAVLRSVGVEVVALFAPEHGLAAAVPDATHVGSYVDKATGLPVYSLYDRATRMPNRQHLQGINSVICDIQDVGVRFYTFVWSLYYTMEAAAEGGVEVIVLDRPNPLGDGVAGPLLLPELQSFVGLKPLPIQHGLTLGELALLMRSLWVPRCRVRIVHCNNWSRQPWEGTGLHWVPPSPNMPHISTVKQYPGACFIEGTNLSEGRGTPLPFEITGAPWIDSESLASTLNKLLSQYGSVIRPHTFIPTASKWTGEECQGIQVYINSSALWDPICTWLCIIYVIMCAHPGHFSWLLPNSSGVEAGTDYHFDRLVGTQLVRAELESARTNCTPPGEIVSQIHRGWASDCDQFCALRARFQIYHKSGALNSTIDRDSLI
ncbi:N-acetylmuramic acid 6-phosphate etherase [Pelomyxa schiedti]|nr:N-acetylmuramic acid 6-phosphate etherase [Pelomyxa schiedti]